MNIKLSKAQWLKLAENAGWASKGKPTGLEDYTQPKVPEDEPFAERAESSELAKKSQTSNHKPANQAFMGKESESDHLVMPVSNAEIEDALRDMGEGL